MRLAIEIKSNSIEVALCVFVVPRAVSRSGSVPQLKVPSFKSLSLKVFPPEAAYLLQVKYHFQKEN